MLAKDFIMKDFPVVFDEFERVREIIAQRVCHPAVCPVVWSEGDCMAGGKYV
jgi:hypothetical protein